MQPQSHGSYLQQYLDLASTVHFLTKPEVDSKVNLLLLHQPQPFAFEATPHFVADNRPNAFDFKANSPPVVPNPSLYQWRDLSPFSLISGIRPRSELPLFREHSTVPGKRAASCLFNPDVCLKKRLP